ncbi:MAG: anaerobic glycerol-3-phosphate dehydrogenase subunit GlpA [Desulfobacterales bacterium]
MQTRVLIIGGGVTGTGLARDLSMRGIPCIVVEKQDINAGASGGNHGLLHSGARYIVSDPASARECHDENLLLKKTAPHCIEETGGLFVAVKGDDEKYISQFPDACRKCGIPVRELDTKEARLMEPALSPDIIAAFSVDDATIDPFKLSLDNMACAKKQGSQVLCHSRVSGFEKQGGRIVRTHVTDELTGRNLCIEAEIVVNASGAWAGIIASLAGEGISMRYSKGSLAVTQNRIAGRVVNRLRMPTDGDILVPGGTVSILGTTSRRVESPDLIYPETREIDEIIDQGAAMIPELSATRYIRAYCGVRPLPAGDGKNQNLRDDRSASRGYELIDHGDSPEGPGNFITITGGKLTTSRLMAEKTADMVCGKLGVNSPCLTGSRFLDDAVDAKWTEPAMAPIIWLRKSAASEDILLCECEMIPQSVVDEISENICKQEARPGLKALGLRSRIGKGPCQGTFCSQRAVAYLYDQGYLNNREGVHELKAFLNERWRGQQPLLWNKSLIQAELMEAMHCGLFSLELHHNQDNNPA